MEFERKGVSIDWLIENVTPICSQEMKLYSPVISVEVMDETKWKLGLLRISAFETRLTIKREEDDNGPHEIPLDYEFYVNSPNIISVRKKISSFTFRKGKECPVVLLNMSMINPDVKHDTFTIQCKIWRQQKSISKSADFFARTRLMKIKSYIFRELVENFSDFSENETRTLKIVKSCTGERLMQVNLGLNRRYINTYSGNSFGSVEDLLIELIPMDCRTEQFFYFQLFILDSFGNITDIGEVGKSFSLKSPVRFPLPKVSKVYLMGNAALYLPNGNLSLHCEITFCSREDFRIEYERVERTAYETDNDSEIKQTYFSKAVECFISNMDMPCDVKIKTTTETFPTHISILSAYSPVFKAMFETNMKEAIQKCVHIDDLEADTMKNMLVFMYSDTIEVLEWKEAMKLYFAADKYQVDSLKNRCSAILQKSLSLSNCYVLLLLADILQDENLKRSVQSYITENAKQVFRCDKWTDLRKKHLHLTINF